MPNSSALFENRSMTPDLIPSATKLVASAFFDNPAHIYICPDRAIRLSRLEFFLGGNLKIQPASQRSFCLVEGSTLRAMGFWTTSFDVRVGVRELVHGGFLLAPIRLGLDGFRRMMEVSGEIDRAAKRAVGNERFWYLHNMVVHEKLRGTGIGSRLLREQLDWIGREDPEATIVLATQRPENVSFYERSGFKVVSELEVGRGPHAFVNWTLSRKAAHN